MKMLRTALQALVEGIANAPRDLVHLALAIIYFNRPGRVHFNVDGDFDGHLRVRPNTASGGFAVIGFHVDNPFCIRGRRISGRTMHQIMTQALVEGLDPIRVYIDGQPIRFYKPGQPQQSAMNLLPHAPSEYEQRTRAVAQLLAVDSRLA